jgi:type VI protein secretion system component VasK
MKRSFLTCIAVLAAVALVLCMLSFWQGTAAAQKPTVEMPFANPTEQRAETLSALREIRDLLKEQNALLRSGKLQVVVTLPEPAPPTP